MEKSTLFVQAICPSVRWLKGQVLGSVLIYRVVRQQIKQQVQAPLMILN